MANGATTFSTLRVRVLAAKREIDRVHVFTTDGREWTFKFDEWTIEDAGEALIFTNNAKPQVVVLFYGQITAYKFD